MRKSSSESSEKLFLFKHIQPVGEGAKKARTVFKLHDFLKTGNIYVCQPFDYLFDVSMVIIFSKAVLSLFFVVVSVKLCFQEELTPKYLQV